MVPQIISFKCVLKTKIGTLISTTYNREVLTAVPDDDGGLLPGLSRELQNLKKGEKRNIELTAKDAYGLYYPNKVILYPRSQLPRETRVGETITIVSPKGRHNTYKVIEFFSNFARLDGNHPLAGQDLVFEIEALDARNATKDEIDSASNPVQKQVIH
jgi:FKBP-type peptidyl-prolyl cis-trans isomerase SlyD